VEDRFFVVQHSCGGIALIVGLEEHVQPPERPGTVVHARQHLVPQDPLAGFAEGAWRRFDEEIVDLGDLEQVLA